MKTLAAVLVRTNAPLELLDLEIPPLNDGQVLVEIAYSGVCGTQVMERAGKRGPDRFLPHCLGHEAGGVVCEIGPGVKKCRVDDQVVLSWIKGVGADVSSTCYKHQGKTVNAGGVTTFSRLAVVSENRTTAAPEEIDLKQAALLGCAAATGFGAVWNTAAARPGQSIAVFGVGGVGLCAIAAAVAAGLAPVIAVDINPQRLEAAKTAGAATLDASQIDPVEEIRRMASGGLDLAIECSGRVEVMQQALAAVRPQGGATVVVGNAAFGNRLEIDPHHLNQGKRLLGTWGGDTQPDRDFPRYARLLSSENINAAQFMKRSMAHITSQTYPLEEINTAVDDLEHGRTLRPLIAMKEP